MSFFDKIRRLFGQASSSGEAHRAEKSARVSAAAPEPAGSDSACPESEGVDGEMIPCEEALRHVHEYLDGELEGMPREQVKRHFDVCGRCYPHLRLERSYRDAVRRAAAGEAAPPELKERVSRLLAEARAED